MPVFESVRHECRIEPRSIIAAFLSEGSELALAVRFLKAKLDALDKERPARCLGMVSAASGEGKSTLAVGLAAARARDAPARVLLVEIDFHRPMLEQMLGLPPGPGMADWLREPGADVLPIREVAPLGFYLLSAGTDASRHAELLTPHRVKHLVDSARATFDFVVFDCPPLLPIPDSLSLQSVIDGFLLVVRARHTPAPIVRRAVSHLKPDSIIASVFNGERGHTGAAYSPYYRGTS